MTAITVGTVRNLSSVIPAIDIPNFLSFVFFDKQRSLTNGLAHTSSPELVRFLT
nr:MAG TPA: hypothetical protein [Caudoviricetes sp.]